MLRFSISSTSKLVSAIFIYFTKKKPLKTMENAFTLAKKKCFDSLDIRYFLLPSVRFLPLLVINKFTGEADGR